MPGLVGLVIRLPCRLVRRNVILLVTVGTLPIERRYHGKAAAWSSR